MIKKGDFVKISYTAKLEDGTVIDSTDENIAKEHGVYEEHARYGDVIIVVGEGHVLKGLDEALEGKEVGFRGSIEIPPEKAFGKYDPENKEVITLTKFKEKPSVGERVRVGNKVGIVEKIVGRRAIIDFNHPLAGKKVIFDYEIKEKIDDPVEKVKSLFLIHTGRELDVKIHDGKTIVNVPKDVSINQYFIIGKLAVVESIFKHLPDIREVEFVERFLRDEMIKKDESKDEKSTEVESEVESKS